MNMKLGVVLLAAGRSARFGGNKLLADFGGRPLICRTLEAAKAVCAQKICVVASDDDVAALACLHGYCVIRNDAPQLGQAHSIRLGISAVQDMDAALLLVCDQPGLMGGTLKRLMQEFAASEKGIACLRDETHMGNPAVFSKAYFPQLLALSGDRGAKGILRMHEDDLLVISCVHAEELADADTPEALENIRLRMGK